MSDRKCLVASLESLVVCRNRSAGKLQKRNNPGLGRGGAYSLLQASCQRQFTSSDPGCPFAELASVSCGS